MERRKFFKSLGLLGLAAVIPKFLLGNDKRLGPNQIISGSFSNECVIEDDLIFNNLISSSSNSKIVFKNPDGSYSYIKMPTPHDNI